jgi:hypothetical protein
MEENKKEEIHNQINQTNDNIKQLKLSHEALNYEFDRNIRNLNLILEQNYLNKEDRQFFIDWLNDLNMLRKQEYCDYEDMNDGLKRKAKQFEEEMEDLEKKESTDVERD